MVSRAKRYGLLGIMIAQKQHTCQLKDKCLSSAIIERGEPHINLMAVKPLPVGGMVPPENRPDTGEDGFISPGELQSTFYLKSKFIVSRFHLDCISEWAKWIALNKLNEEPKKGRTPDQEIASLPDNVKQFRRKLAQLRSQALKEAVRCSSPLKELQCLLKSQSLLRQINDIGVPLRSSGISSPHLTEIIMSHTCNANNRATLHSLGEDYHCIGCGKCYSTSHIHT